MQTFKNFFSGGRNTDLSHDKVPPNQYIEAHNVELVGDGNFASLRNVNGTTHVQNLVNSPLVEVMKVIPAKFSINSNLYNCLVVFTVIPEDTFNIFCYDTENDTLYELYEEEVDDTYETRIVQAENHPEGGIDIVYFTDFHNEVRALRCEIPSPYSANFLTAYDLSLLRRGANGTITFSSTASGGTLLSGTYQFAYRMVDPDTNKKTKWSSLTNPIHVYDKANSTTSPVYSGVGLLTDRKITISIAPSTAETDHFDHLQLAVIENVGPTAPTVASLLDIEAIPSTSLSYEYKSNSKIGTIPLEDIVVDLAQIEKAKTLNIKENRLFLGNLQYTELEMDNGTPEITSGSILRQAGSARDGFSDDNHASQYVGYWRGEVYRFAVVYTDKYGNKSAPQILDLSSVTGNQISGATDMKFPDRSTANTYTIFNTDGKIQSLGLRLTGLTNHPTWATSVEIVRVKRSGRYKNILFQSPLIPMAKVYGIGAQSDYPTTYFSGSGNGAGEKTVEDAQPMTSGFTYVPKNLFWPELRHIKRRGTVGNSTGTFTYKAAGEAFLQRIATYDYAALFPPDSMYSSTPFIYTGAEKLDVIDYSLLKTKWSDFSDSTLSASYDVGDFLKTSIAGNFYALTDAQYYFDSSHGKAPLSSLDNITISDYKFFSNLGQADTVGGNSVLDFDSLQTTGVSIYPYKPSIQKMGVIQLGTTLTEGQIIFSAGTLNAVGNANNIIGSSGPKYEGTNELSNKYVSEYGSFTEGSSYISALPIVNVKLGLGDDRYGSTTDVHEFISTGSRYTFTSSEVTTLEGGGSVSINLDVWGGDCYIGAHLFKISDSAYSIVNQGKNWTPSDPDDTTTTPVISTEKWEGVYRYEVSGDDPVICLPVAVENSGQFVQVILESEYSEVRDLDGLTTDGNETGIPIFMSESEASIRTPLTYKYNPNLSKQNDQKVYISKPEFFNEQNTFSSRIAYSDLKIYNSDSVGFDVFRVGNIYDLEEKYYPIIKLSLAGDNLYAIQERAITYLPTGERQIEASDAGTLSVRSGDVIGRPILIDGSRGSQHANGIIETGSVIYISDNRNKSVYVLGGQELRPITKDNETAFREFFATQTEEENIISIYDPVRREVWFLNNDAQVEEQFCHVFNEALGVWVSDYDFDSTCKGGAYTNQNLYLVGRVSDPLEGQHNCSIHTMYTKSSGTITSFFEFAKAPSVTVVVNPHPEIAKTFDDTLVVADQRISGADFVVSRETSQGNQGASKDLDVAMYEGSYRVKNPRDADGARLRGLVCQITFDWDTHQAALKAIGQKYRFSARHPW